LLFFFFSEDLDRECGPDARAEPDPEPDPERDGDRELERVRESEVSTGLGRSAGLSSSVCRWLCQPNTLRRGGEGGVEGRTDTPAAAASGAASDEREDA